MYCSDEVVRRMGFRSVDEIVGRTADEYLPRELADKYLQDDQRVIKTGEPSRNLVELYLNERGIRDWIITDKYPLRNAAGKVVGLVGTIQSFESRRKVFAHLGPVGHAADFIREHLRQPLGVPEIARHVGLSTRQIQRLFFRTFGITILKFIIQSRIHAAIHELIHTQRPLAEIASLFGFGDQSAFTNTFRKATGMTPRKYRAAYVAQFGINREPA